MQKLFGIMIMVLLVAASCGEPANDYDDSQLSVLVSIVPQKTFVESIAGDLATVNVLIPPGASPASYELSPSDMQLASEAEIWFSMGVASERTWAEDLEELNPDMIVINVSDGIERLPIDRYGIPQEHHHEESDHGHHEGEEDPHIWLSPELVKVQLRSMADAIAEIDPENSQVYRNNLETVIGEVNALQEGLHEVLDPFQGSSFLVFHPAWGYFADEFGLVQVPIEIAGSDPSPGELSEIIDHAREANIRFVFVSPQFSTASAETIAEEIGAVVSVIDPLAEDWFENMRRVAADLAEAL